MTGGKFMALTASIKKLERSYTTNLTAYLTALEEKEANTPKRNRRQETIKLKDEATQAATKKMV